MRTDEPKYRLIKDKIAERINSGELPVHSRVPSESELIADCHVSSITVRAAMKDLLREGLIYRIRGKGSFVAEKKIQSNVNADRLCGLVFASEGDVNSEIIRELSDLLYSQDYYPITCFDQAELEGSSIVKGLSEKGVSRFIVDGKSPMLDKYIEQFPENASLTFIHRYETDRDYIPNANYVLSDYRKGGYLAMEHLLSAGCSEIAVVSCQVKSEIHPLLDTFEGCREAAVDQGIQFDRHVHFVENNDWGGLEGALTDMIKDKGVDGIFVTADCYAVSAFGAAGRLGLRIPEDLKIIGYFDTAWVNSFAVPLTSISIREAELAGAAAGLIKTGALGKRLNIEPELVIRQSTVVREVVKSMPG